jgi:histidine triad (HIT) family protein
MTADCVFCRILAGTAPASFVWRDELCSAFMDIKPVNAGHLLIVPNRHAPYLSELDASTAGHLMNTAHRLAAALRASGLRCEGINLFLADGEAAMQEVFHVHLHVFPRYLGDGFGLRFGEAYHRPPARRALEAAAEQVRAALV